MINSNSKSPVSKMNRGIRISIIILLVLLAVVYCIYSYNRTGTIYPTEELFDELPTIRFVDVGQGDCTLITYQGNSVLIDAGTTQNGPITAEYVSTYAPVIDYFIITHPHEDHMGGATYIFDYAIVENLVVSDISAEEDTYLDIFLKAFEQGTNIIYLDEPTSFIVGEIYITVLDTFGLEYDDLNDSSMITRIDVCETSILFPGDAEAVAEKYALSNNSPELLDCDVLKLGHHGSSSSTTEEFLITVSPEICIASAGKNNSYGHPSGVIVSRVEDYGAVLRRTDIEGTIVIRGEK